MASTSVSPPSLMSSSTTSATPSQPSTAQLSPPRTPPQSRGRPDTRYPGKLSKANGPLRVPLHRRGTSRTYETLEDLLKEAGYKETRIFTPETDKKSAREGGQGDDSSEPRRTGVMSFLSGLVQGGASQQQTSALSRSDQPDLRSLPPSPLAGKLQLPPDLTITHAEDSPFTPISGYASSTSSHTRTQQARTRRLPTNAHPHHPQTPTHQYFPDERVLRAQPSLPNHTGGSRAHAILRHIASAPSVARAHSAAPQPALRTHDARRPIVTVDGPLSDSPPPLPTSWLETVARALLGVPGAHVGGPTMSGAPSAHTSPALSRDGTIRPGTQMRRGYTAPVFTDYTNRPPRRGRMPTLGTLRPPSLLTGVHPAAPGSVAKTRVVCRSAPASRSVSLVRAVDLGTARKRGGARRQAKGKQGRKNKAGGPSLKGRVEDDLWGLEDGDGDDEEESEEEGEVDLARLLVSPKRQQSIQSLRRHLQRPARVKRIAPVADEERYQSDGAVLTHEQRRSLLRRGSMNGGEWESEGGTFLETSRTRKRRALPRTWANTGMGEQ